MASVYTFWHVTDRDIRHSVCTDLSIHHVVHNQLVPWYTVWRLADPMGPIEASNIQCWALSPHACLAVGPGVRAIEVERTRIDWLPFACLVRQGNVTTMRCGCNRRSTYRW